MTKKFLNYSLLVTLCALSHVTSYAATTPWWMQPTVCRLDPTDCYPAMGAGFESEMWDSTSNCWGLKLICPDALTNGKSTPVAMGRADIDRGININPDFNTDLLSTEGECFGRRKTATGGTTASVNGKYVNVWCPGILNNADEILENGEITYGTQPTCSSLAEYGYVGIENGRCYGKYYDTNNYYIECGTAPLPTRLIVLNGADYTAPMNGAPVDDTDAKRKFDTMYSTSQKQKAKYFAE